MNKGIYPIVFLDTETTGLDPFRATVLEVAMIRREADGSESRFHSKIRPTEQELEEAEPEALRVNGYAANPEAWEGAPTMAEVGGQISDFVKGARALCGHNVSFDEKMLAAALKRHGILRKIPYHKIDTVTLAFEHLVPLGLGRVSLDSVRDFLGWSREGAHAALKDAEDAMRLFDLCWRMGFWRRLLLWARLRLKRG
jgi:DNA polymerase III epsilon subunit-like protein